jgi:hypothetical protein
MGTGTGNYAGSEIIFQSPDQTYANATTVAIAQSWNGPTKALTITNIAGEFLDAQSIIGLTSKANYILTTYNELSIVTPKEVYDNQYINNTAGSIIDLSESNPFGSI